MRDLIWTLILIWAVYRIFSVFRIGSSASGQRTSYTETGNNAQSAPRDDNAKKAALRKHLNNEGEYVDYEEIR